MDSKIISEDMSFIMDIWIKVNCILDCKIHSTNLTVMQKSTLLKSADTILSLSANTWRKAGLRLILLHTGLFANMASAHPH